jgi:hypothetical protein
MHCASLNRCLRWATGDAHLERQSVNVLRVLGHRRTTLPCVSDHDLNALHDIASAAQSLAEGERFVCSHEVLCDVPLDIVWEVRGVWV